MIKKTTLTVLVLACAAGAANAQTRDAAVIRGKTDSIVAAALKDGRAAGMTVAVVRGRDTLVLKGYGMADLEFDVPTPPHAIYEIGSVTKQFTASAILQLRDAGKLSLDDTITKFLPQLSLQGNVVTIRRLLDHTSGLKSYTEMPEFRSLMMQKLARDTLVHLISVKPFDFKPGDVMIYNNSGYFLLGLIIEKASGTAYADYIKANFFDKLGMKDSRYCSERAVVKNRAHGYDTGPGGLVRAAYLDHTWPYAAGSICSSAADLVTWNFALHGGKVLSPASYQELITPGTLNDGTRLRYAKGLMVDSVFGRPVITHSGGINGFLSNVDYFPQDSMVVVALVNTAGPVNPEGVMRSIEEVLFGKAHAPSIALEGSAAQYAGTYEGLGRGATLKLAFEPDSTGKSLMLRFGREQPRPLTYYGNQEFRSEGGRFTFLRADTKGPVIAVRADNGGMMTVLKRTTPSPASN